jgi:predicted kinase
MTKTKLLVLRGISASGKTTYAHKLEHEGWIRVEKDEIRKNDSLFKDGVYNHKRGDEGIVLRERDRIIRNALRDGLDVVSSDTNLNPVHVRQLQAIARQLGAEFSVDDSFLAVPLAELIERDAKREASVGEAVIRKQFHDFVKTMPTFLTYDPNLPWCVVSDVDGTLTNGPKNRTPYEWHKVGNDEINLGVAKILDGVRVIDDTKIFLMSGRSDVCRPETEEWLERNDIEYDELYMRPANRESDKDTVIKSELIEEHIRGQYNVLFWLDDRPQVATMLRDVYGINVLQRGDPYHKF